MTIGHTSHTKNLLSRESKRKFTELEGKLREDLLMAKIRDTENSQCVAELTQKISNLEFKVAKSFFGSDRSPQEP